MLKHLFSLAVAVCTICFSFNALCNDIKSIPPIYLYILSGESQCVDADVDGICDAIDLCVGDVDNIDYDGDGILFACDPDFGNIGPICGAIDQVCVTNRQCCSQLCVDNGSGISFCESLNGCRPANEFCTQDSDCCSYSVGTPGACVLIGSSGVGRCVGGIPGPSGIGEICGEGASNNCINGAETCRLTGEGVDRCFTSTSCLVDEEKCYFNDECCNNNCVQGVSGLRVCEPQ